MPGKSGPNLGEGGRWAKWRTDEGFWAMAEEEWPKETKILSGKDSNNARFQNASRRMKLRYDAVSVLLKRMGYDCV